MANLDLGMEIFRFFAPPGAGPVCPVASARKRPHARPPMKVLCLHAHYDDFEFYAGGTFEMLRRAGGPDFRAKVVVCTDGQAGHHFRTRAETGRMRRREQEESARIGGYAFELLTLPNGQAPREACLRIGADFLAALWKTIRDFEPDYLFCPPVVSDPLAGIHIDHVAVATAVREVAYMINVPHAFTPEYPADETQSRPCKVPVILNVYDPYMAGLHGYDFAVDVEPAFDVVCAESWCHQSQIREWLPWVGRHRMAPPSSPAAWAQVLRARFDRQGAQLGLPPGRAYDVFTVTAWGEIPTLADLRRDFPALAENASHLDQLAERLARWHV